MASDEAGNLFLCREELRELTGRSLKSAQIEALRRMAVPFRVNALGRPVVTRAAIIGTQVKQETTNSSWSPRVLARG